MVIEYAGIVIRSVLTDKREKYYDGKVSRWSLFHSSSVIDITGEPINSVMLCFYRALVVTCSALMTLTLWMPQCMAMQQDSSITHVNPTATPE